MNETKMKLPKSIEVGDITIRDGLQALEHYYPVEDKLAIVEDLILAGYKHLEVTNFGHPKALPQFKDAEELLDRLFHSERVGPMLKQNGGDVQIHTITINERGVDRCIAFKEKHGVGPDYGLQMVSTDPAHHKVNSGTSLDAYFEMSGQCIKKCHEAGIKMCGTVSTIWGSPMEGTRVTDLKTAVEFSKRYLELGADYIEQADHDGSADPVRVYEYFRMILDPEIMGKWADTRYHLAHFHTSRGMGLANYLAALQAGVLQFETTLAGTGGQPACLVDGRFTGGTGGYYHKEHLLSGLVSTEDFIVMAESMGIDTGIDVLKLLEVGKKFKQVFIDIKPADLKQMLANATADTGIPLEKLEGLPEATDEEVAALVSQAAEFQLSKPDMKGKPERIHRNMETLLHSVKGYLVTNMWGYPRSESIVSGVPPSPFLDKLL